MPLCMEIPKACPVALLLQLSQNVFRLNQLIIWPLNIALGEWISDVCAAVAYSLYRTSISAIIGFHIVGMSKYRYTHSFNKIPIWKMPTWPNNIPKYFRLMVDIVYSKVRFSWFVKHCNISVLYLTRLWG